MTTPTCDEHTHVLATYSDRVHATWCACSRVVLTGNHLACACHPQRTATTIESEAHHD